MKYLITTFTRIGLLTFGGGSSVTPLLFEEFVEKTKVLDNEEFVDIVTIANVLPGPSMIQMATAIGYKLRGNLGSIIAPICISVPSILIFTFCMAILSKFVDFKILIVITSPLFLVIGFSMLQVIKKLKDSTKFTILSYFIFAVAFILMFFFDIPAGFIVIGAILVGLVRGVIYVD